MKANELRIGNLIYGCYYDENISDDELLSLCEVLAIDLTGNSEHEIYVDSKENIEHFNNFKPIPITEEWLLKFGFEKRDLFTFYKDKLCIRIKNPLDKFDPNGRVYWNSWTILEKQPEYVHQLQNLYFAITGEELTINQ